MLEAIEVLTISGSTEVSCNGRTVRTVPVESVFWATRFSFSGRLPVYFFRVLN